MNNTDKKIYLLYFFLLPFAKLFRLDEIIGTKYMFVNISTFVMLYGVARLVFSSYLPSFEHMKKWWHLYMFTTIYSVIMACVFFSLGTVAGKTTFDCIPRSIVLNFLAILSIYYNSIAFSRFICLDDLIPVIKKQNYILLALGYIQFGMLHGVSGCAQLNDTLASIFSICKSDYLILGDRGITLFGSEPSSIGLLMIVTIPFILSVDIKEKKWISTILWSILFLSSGSSQALVMFSIGLTVALFIRYKGRVLKIFYIMSFGLGTFMAFFYTFGIDVTKEFTNDGSLSYMLYGKLVDVNNHSTCTRVSSIINDILIFKDYPLTGVGDGIQGFFFRENTPLWCYGAEEVQSFLTGKAVASGGGNFFASYISAYGILGILLLILFTKKYLRDRTLLLGQCDNIVIHASSIGLIVFLATGWYTVSFFNNEYVPLMLSLPYLGLSTYKKL